MFRRLKSTDSEGTLPTQLTSEQDGSQWEEGNYPPRDKGVERMLKYITANKKLPAEIPQALIQQSRDAHVLNDYPRHLIPKETKCTECDCMLSDPVLITSKGRILSANSVIEGNSFITSCFSYINMLIFMLIVNSLQSIFCSYFLIVLLNKKTC